MDALTETATIGKVSISDTGEASKVITGPGVTVTSWEQNGGVNVMQAATRVTAQEVNGGRLTTEGDYTITIANANGGTLKRDKDVVTANTLNSPSGLSETTIRKAA